MEQDTANKEEWRDVVGWEGFYKISSYGRLYSVERTIRYTRAPNVFVERRIGGFLMKPSELFCQKGKLMALGAVLRNHGHYKNVTIHSLVLQAFMGIRPKGKEGCHYDGNPRNNYLNNLRYDTSKANQADKKRHGTQHVAHGEKDGRHVLREEEVRHIRLLRKKGLLIKYIANIYNVEASTVSKICIGTRWKHI